MAENRKETRVNYAGGFYINTDIDSPIPTRKSEFAPTTFLAGFLKEEGIGINATADSTSINGWPRGEKIREVNSNGNVELSAAVVQTENEKNSDFYFGKEQDADGGWVLDAAYFGKEVQVYTVGIDVENGRERLYVFPAVKLSNRGEIRINHTELEAYDMTLNARYDERIGGQYKRYSYALEEDVASAARAAVAEQTETD